MSTFDQDDALLSNAEHARPGSAEAVRDGRRRIGPVGTIVRVAVAVALLVGGLTSDPSALEPSR